MLEQYTTQFEQPKGIADKNAKDSYFCKTNELSENSAGQRQSDLFRSNV